MRDKLNRFIDNTIGQFIEISYLQAEYQCMDLVYTWVFCLDFPKSTIQHQYAYEVYSQATDFTRQYFDIIPNLKETIPQEGDLVVWNKTAGNVAGHIAIVLEATQTKMKVFEQNSPLGSNAHLSDKAYTNVLGFLRPKYKTEGGVPQYLATLLQESGLTADQESEVRVFWDKAKRYDDDTKSLQEQVKSVSEALADRALEVSELTEKNQKLSDAKGEAEEQLNKKRGEYDSLSWEKTQLEVSLQAFEDKIKDLMEKVKQFEEKNPLKAYSWGRRFLSLFGGD